MPDNMHRVGIGAEDSEFQAVMAGMVARIKQTTDIMESRLARAETSFSRLERSARSFGHAITAYISWQAIENVGRAALEQERAIGGLSSAYQSAGVYSDGLMTRSISLANEMQRLANVEDDAIESGMALMMNIGRLSENQIPAATRAAIGLSEAYSLDLEAAFKLVGKAAAGQTETLARYGIVVDTSRSKSEQFNQVLDAGARGFAQAERNARDSLGTYEQMVLVFGDLKEAIGGVASTPIALKGAENLTNNIIEITNYVSNLGLTIDLISVKFQKMFVRASGALTQAQLASGQIPGAKNAGLTAESVQISINQQLAQLDKWALNAVNEWERKQNNRMRALGNRPVKTIVDEIESASSGGGASARGGRISTRWEKSEFERLAKQEERWNADQRRNEEAQRKEDETWFNRQIELTEQKQKAEYEYLDGVRERNAQTMEDIERRQRDMADWWGGLMYNLWQDADGSFANIGKSFDRMLRSMAVKAAIYGFANLITGGTFGAGVKIGLGLTGRGSGGPVSSGTPYIVGERGPELFVPSAAGRIVPSQTWNNNVSMSFTFSPADRREMAEMSDSQLARKLVRVVRDHPRLVREIAGRS